MEYRFRRRDSHRGADAQQQENEGSGEAEHGRIAGGDDAPKTGMSPTFCDR
jgi:hypothetical protein